jgi:hypothetical protein
MAVAGAGMIGMAMGDQRPVDAAHRIYEEIPRRAVKPFAAGDQQVFGFHFHANQVGRLRACKRACVFRAANA